MKILVIPDCQVKPGVPLRHLEWIGRYIVEKRPDVIVNIGDFSDMPSLSSYDVGKKDFEGRRYKSDVDATIYGQKLLFKELRNLREEQARFKKKMYSPRLVLTLGNHENRINRAVNNDPKLDGVLSIDDLKYQEFGWEVSTFLEVVVINGVAFSHYFPTGVAGRPPSTANAQLTKQHMSCISGHQQGRQVAYGKRADGKRVTSIIAGSCYLHDEAYIGGPQQNKYWRGILMLHEVVDGEFDEMFVSLNYLEGKYGR